MSSKIIIHSDYNKTLIINDIALIKLSKPVKLDLINYHIIPVCIPTTSDYNQNKTAYATGWGSVNVNIVIVFLPHKHKFRLKIFFCNIN
jgi:hypothetical protein